MHDEEQLLQPPAAEPDRRARQADAGARPAYHRAEKYPVHTRPSERHIRAAQRLPESLYG